MRSLSYTDLTSVYFILCFPSNYTVFTLTVPNYYFNCPYAGTSTLSLHISPGFPKQPVIRVGKDAVTRVYSNNLLTNLKLLVT